MSMYWYKFVVMVIYSKSMYWYMYVVMVIVAGLVLLV